MRGQIRAALAHHATAIALRTAAFGDGDRSVATARFHRAETAIEGGLLRQATADLTAARAIRARHFGETSPRLGEIEAALGDVAAAAGRRDQALAHYDRAAALDARLELEVRRVTAGAALPTELAPDARALGPLSVDHVTQLAVRLAHVPRDRARVLASELHARWQTAEATDARLALAVADALVTSGDHARGVEVARTALAALADEPSRTRLRALHRIAAAPNPQAEVAARALAAAMPELRPRADRRPRPAGGGPVTTATTVAAPLIRGSPPSAPAGPHGDGGCLRRGRPWPPCCTRSERCPRPDEP